MLAGFCFIHQTWYDIIMQCTYMNSNEHFDQCIHFLKLVRPWRREETAKKIQKRARLANIGLFSIHCWRKWKTFWIGKAPRRRRHELARGAASGLYDLQVLHFVSVSLKKKTRDPNLYILLEKGIFTFSKNGTKAPITYNVDSYLMQNEIMQI